MSAIAAISTPNAPGGIAVIRISGDTAFEVADAVFRSVNGKKACEMSGYTCAYGFAYDGDERIDDCILTVFRAPNSYTGENVAEISCHGGLYVTKRILRTVLENGAETASAGEFTKRAFINGKIDLTQAEAVMDIISAKGEKELKMAEILREGAAFKKSQSAKEKLIKVLGDLAAWADYPEDDIPEVEPETLKKLSSEMEIDGYKIRPVECSIVHEGKEGTTVGMILYEGRNRQIRKMCEKIGVNVVRLRRIAVGDIRMGGLESGKWKMLSRDQVKYLKQKLKMVK